jgi:hypothetical protein
MARLGIAYARHKLRPPAPGSAHEVLLAYAEDRLLPLTPGERQGLPAMSRCVNCGLCALVVKRFGDVRPPDLATAYLRDHTLLRTVVRDVAGPDPGPHAMAAAAAACPVGVPLNEVAAAVRRLSGLESD